MLTGEGRKSAQRLGQIPSPVAISGHGGGSGRGPRIRAAALLLMLATQLQFFGCRRDMQDQPKYKAFQPSSFFADGRASRPLVAHTVARGHLDDDTLLYTGKSNGAPAQMFPLPVTRAVLERGHQRYDIFCSPCHDRVGNGNGMIVQRGYRRPQPFHSDRLRTAPPGYFFDVITNGFGVMPTYAAQVPVRDRWAIVAYIRALQLSQHATLADVPAAEILKLNQGANPRTADTPTENE